MENMNAIEKYINTLPEERKEVMQKLREIVNANLPEGFEETMSYNIPGWVVPKSIYPQGYHCKPNPPLPFLSIASQKSHIGFYHMGMYADEKLYKWFVDEYPKHATRKLDMGKSCIRFKKMDDIPYDLLAELVKKMTPQDWIERYESAFVK
ncbi:MAG: DUF1801 domain-containing protein [Crocinitomicaceae bacterium]|nr:DUF1801 domain-containing protein [Crocinitomicaceae bacterium]